jgi:soluble lytic murein transglycosylase-like protein
LKPLRIGLMLGVFAAVPVALTLGMTAKPAPIAPSATPSPIAGDAASNILLELIRSKAPRLTDVDLNKLVYALEHASELTGLPRELLLAVIEVESAYETKALSDEGAIGLMQVKPIAAADVGIDPERLYDPYWNVVTGALYLDRMRRTFSSLGLALAAYAAGPGNVAKGIIPQWYVRRVEHRVAALLERRAAALEMSCDFP